jgi:hypothetical protein
LDALALEVNGRQPGCMEDSRLFCRQGCGAIEPAIWGLGIVVWAFDGDGSLHDFVISSGLALVLGVPLVFLVGLGVQMLPSRWYQP